MLPIRRDRINDTGNRRMDAPFRRALWMPSRDYEGPPVQDVLARAGVELLVAEAPPHSALGPHLPCFDVMLIDAGLGTDAASAASTLFPEAPLVVVADDIQQDRLRDWANAGATDFLAHDELEPRRIGKAIELAVARHRRYTLSGALDASRAQHLMATVDELEVLATHDALTGLLNRRAFMARLDRSVRRARPEDGYSSALLFLDLDGFKAVNDSLGHLGGDVVLKEVARRLESTLRPKDVVGRFGGDEFLILLEDINRREAAQAAQRILNDLLAPLIVKGSPVRVYGSIGVVSTAGRENAEDVVRAADRAMYRAKESGGGFAMFGVAAQGAERARAYA